MRDLLSRLATRVDTAGAQARQRAFREGWPSTTSDDIRFFDSGLVQYRYRERGSGPTVVFAADPPTTLEAYDELLELYAPHFRVIVVELPAMGFSASGGQYRFGWQETNDDLARFVGEVAGEGAVLAFSCVAGLGAVDIAVRYPALVSRLVLIQTADPAAFARWKASRDPKGILGRPFIGQWAMKRLGPSCMHAWYRLAVGREDRLDDFCSCAESSFEHGALWALASAYQRYLDPDAPLGVAEQPALTVWGELDGSHPPEHREAAARMVRHAEAAVLPNVGHFPELESPGDVLALLLDFVPRPSGG